MPVKPIIVTKARLYLTILGDGASSDYLKLTLLKYYDNIPKKPLNHIV